MASEDTFEVGDMDRLFIVNLNQRTCDCGAFQLVGIPCKHAALGIIYKREKLEDYCDQWFSKDIYLKAYASMIHPIPHEKRWPPMDEITPKFVLPPPLRRAPGRPRVNRRREADEGPSSQPKRSSTLKCGNCGQFGHNMRTCQRAPVQRKNPAYTHAQQMPTRRGKPGRGIANLGLQGSVLWDHTHGNVPIVHSGQGCNSSPSTGNAATNIQVNVQTGVIASKRKRGRPSNATSTNAATGSRRRVAPELVQAPVQAPGDAQAATTVRMNTAATLNSTNISTSGSFSLHF
ncbi:uncharacterized protein LOC113750795 [Coffea eugenioides]|uniref:uncharacterized protein LOC113750795 n=1 Tax=Coffea eugenioides TaxID=49369 RepID=UPI000F605922|nr:uncharacterized protein LOC113750795 [Coffea eugenioides]